MLRASFLIRLGIAAVLGWYAVSIAIDPTTFAKRLPQTLATSGPTASLVIAVVLGILAIFTVLSAFSRITPILATLAFLGLSATDGNTETVILTFGLALATFSLVFIREEHVPWRQRRFLEHVFKPRE